MHAGFLACQVTFGACTSFFAELVDDSEAWNCRIGDVDRPEDGAAESTCSERVPEEILAQHPAPARMQVEVESSVEENPGHVSRAPAVGSDANLQPAMSAEVEPESVWGNEHALHVLVTGAVLSGEPVPDGKAPGLRRRGWASIPAISLPVGVSLVL